MNAQSYPRSEMLNIIAESKLAFMTSGLGNIYDAAQFDLPTIWLPPTNDSQGQQLQMISAKNMVDAHLDWGDIDYKEPQEIVIDRIIKHVHALGSKALNTEMGECYREIKKSPHSRSHKLIEEFGTGGDAAVAKHVRAFLQKIEGRSQ